MHSGSKLAHLDFKALLDDSTTGSWLQGLCVFVARVCVCVCVCALREQ